MVKTKKKRRGRTKKTTIKTGKGIRLYNVLEGDKCYGGKLIRGQEVPLGLGN